MAISDANKAKLNNMCKGANDAGLGTAVQTAQTDIATLQGLIKKSGAYTAVAADQTAGKKVIAAGFTITGAVVQVTRAGVVMALPKVSWATTNLTIDTNGTDYVMTTGDIISYIIF
jgi:hypothetical protein